MTASGQLLGLSDASLNARLFVGLDSSLNGNLWTAGTMTASGQLIGLWDASLNRRLFVAKDASFNGNLWTAGNIKAVGAIEATSYNATSDRRLKSNISSLSTQWDKILSLEPVSFEWKSNTKPDHGFLAQDVFSTYPILRPPINSIVNIDEPTDSQGNPMYYSIDYGKMTPYLWKGMQESMQEIASLKTQLANLETRISLLESKK
jgi:hypothetical protein